MSVVFNPPFHPIAFKDFIEAPSDADAAAKLLRFAIEPLRKGEPVPTPLAELLADAIEASVGKPEKYRGKSLTDELYLTAPNRRPAGSWLKIGKAFAKEFDIEQNIKEVGAQGRAASQIAADFDIGESTAIRYWKTWKIAKKIGDDDLKDL